MGRVDPGPPAKKLFEDQKVLVVSLAYEPPAEVVTRLKEGLAEDFPGYKIRVIAGALNVTEFTVRVPVEGPPTHDAGYH